MGMADYIELKTAIEFVKKYAPTIDGMTTLGCVERALYNAPNADVTEVVRCKDCEYWDEVHGVCDLHTEVNGVWMDAEDFCSKGERREGE